MYVAVIEYRKITSSIIITHVFINLTNDFPQRFNIGKYITDVYL